MDGPTNSLVTPLLTDLYQITMTYAHWKNKRHNEHAVFELFFRKNPFKGAFTIFCGLDEVIKHLHAFRFTSSDIDYLKSTPALQHCHPDFFDYLLQLDASEMQIYALPHGTLAFPRVPLVMVSGPLGVGQLLETTLLTLINYPSLLATNAARMVLRAHDHDQQRRIDGDGPTNNNPPNSTPSPTPVPQQCRQKPRCIEFGLRRAQGPDGGFSASKYAFIGGFAATSNVLAGKRLGIPIAGTHAHAFVQSYLSLDEVVDLTVNHRHHDNDHQFNNSEQQEDNINILSKVLEYRTTLGEAFQKTNDGELAAFIAYASAFPDSFLCLVDTYDTVASGLLNFCLVALVLNDMGYTPKGIRLDSGDLAALSMACAKVFAEMAESQQRPFFHSLDIVASNDINEKTLMELNKQGHAFTLYGIGTNLVTCQAQPALGCVYKLVELNGKPRIKLSQDIVKVTIPGRKRPYRLYGSDGSPLLDVMLAPEEATPSQGKTILCRHPTVSRKRVNVTPSKVETLVFLVFRNGSVLEGVNPSIPDARKAVIEQLKAFRPDILRLTNPAPYKVSLSNRLFHRLHDMWQSQTIIPELS